MFICQHIYFCQWICNLECSCLRYTKPRQTKKQNLTENFWFGAQRCVFLFSLSFSFFGLAIEQPKKNVCFFDTKDKTFYQKVCKCMRLRKFIYEKLLNINEKTLNINFFFLVSEKRSHYTVKGQYFKFPL